MPKRLLPYRRNEATNRWEARCGGCRRRVAFINDEARYLYPEHSALTPVLHNCPCTCRDDPYNCPVGQELANAIHERKGNQ